jgi:eukaryotic-like serine/threonine-protein kinase
MMNNERRVSPEKPMDRLGDYHLRKRLAVGGMGEVHLGEKLGPEGFVKSVVIKSVRPELAQDPSFVQLFLDEARLAGLLQHPNIAQVFDFGLADGVYFIAMEYVAGYTLDDIRRKLAERGHLMPLEHVANIASQACQGLHYAHSLTDRHGESLGLVHRDVSPHNLMVGRDGTVKLVDFGIAKARAGLTRVRAKGKVGKNAYMSPEQAQGESVDGRSDLFSLGVCLWELTTNQRLHPERLDQPPRYDLEPAVRSVDELRAEVPKQFSRILARSLAVRPEERFRDAREMHLALERFQAALTHYAGQAALALFVEDLAEGRLKETPLPDSFSGVERYEEVFGVGMRRPQSRSRPRLTSVPSHWEGGSSPGRPSSSSRPTVTPAGRRPSESSPPLRAPSRPGARNGGAPEGTGRGPRTLELAADPSAPDLQLHATRSKVPIPSPAAPDRPPPGPSRWAYRALVSLLLLLLLVAGGAAWWALRSSGLPFGLGGGTASAPPAAPSNRYRFVSEPPGARLRLDGRRVEGETPLELELLPDVEYVVEASREGRATVQQRVTGRIARGTQEVRFELPPAGTLRVVTKPPGAEVSVDGRPLLGTTPLVATDVPAGRRVQIRVELPGLQPALRTVEISPQGEQREVFRLR